MSKLTQEDFHYIKADLRHGRISPGTIRYGLGAFMVFSAFMVGIAYTVATANNTVIGWENLSSFWQTVFKIEAILFIVQLILVIFVKGRKNWSQILLNVSYVLYTYKMVLDPFVMISMFSMDRGEYEIYRLIILFIIIFGFTLQFYMIRRLFQKLQDGKIENKQKQKEKKRRGYLLYITPFFFILASITGYIISNELLGDMDLLLILGVVMLVFIGVLIGTIEFVIGAYCVIRFPSFRVNPPKEK